MTGKKKGKVKFASAEAKRNSEQLDKDWKALLKRQGIEHEAGKRRRGSAAKSWTTPTIKYRGQDEIKNSVDTGWVPCTMKPAKVYTGNTIIGIATMHKSNAVPVFSSEQALDISKMRR